MVENVSMIFDKCLPKYRLFEEVLMVEWYDELHTKCYVFITFWNERWLSFIKPSIVDFIDALILLDIFRHPLGICYQISYCGESQIKS